MDLPFIDVDPPPLNLGIGEFAFRKAAASKGLIFCIQIRVLKIVNKSRTSSRKSVCPSDVKKKVNFFRSYWYSASTNVTGMLRVAITSLQIAKALASSRLFPLESKSSSDDARPNIFLLLVTHTARTSSGEGQKTSHTMPTS